MNPYQGSQVVPVKITNDTVNSGHRFFEYKKTPVRQVMVMDEEKGYAVLPVLEDVASSNLFHEFKVISRSAQATLGVQLVLNIHDPNLSQANNMNSKEDVIKTPFYCTPIKISATSKTLIKHTDIQVNP